MIEKPQYGLAWFRIRFGMLQLKAYTKASTSCALGPPATTPRSCAAAAGWTTSTRSSPGWPAWLTGSPPLDCADVSFLPDGLDELPLPSAIGAVCTGGIDLNKPRIRAALAAALTLVAAPHGFTVAEFAAKVCQMTLHDGYTIRQAAYDLRKLRGKNLIDKPGRTRRYQIPPGAARPSPPCSPSATT